MKNQNTIYNIIRDTEFSKYLSDNTIIELSKIMSLVDYASNKTIYSKNEPIKKFLILNKGKAKTINNPNQKNRELYENDFFGLISLFTNSFYFACISFKKNMD